MEKSTSDIGISQRNDALFLPLDVFGKVISYFRAVQSFTKFYILSKVFRHYISNENPNCCRNIMFKISSSCSKNTKVMNFVYNLSISKRFEAYVTNKDLMNILPLAPNLEHYNVGCSPKLTGRIFFAMRGIKLRSFIVGIEMFNFLLLSYLDTKSLETLIVRSKPILLTDEVLKPFKNLQTLVVQYNSGISDEGLSGVSKNLKELSLFYCDINDHGLKNIPITLSSLEIFPGISDAGIRHLVNLQQLTELNISFNNRITGSGFKYLPDSLKLLYCDGCENLDSENLSHLPRKIEVLMLWDSNVQDCGMRHLSKLKSLRWVKLMENELLTNRGLKDWKASKSLQILNLLGCPSVTYDGVKHFSKSIKQLLISGEPSRNLKSRRRRRRVVNGHQEHQIMKNNREVDNPYCKYQKRRRSREKNEDDGGWSNLAVHFEELVFLSCDCGTLDVDSIKILKERNIVIDFHVKYKDL